MRELKLAAAESRFAELVWANAPLRTAALVGLCAEAFGWKRTTTYTVLRRLCDRGFFAQEDGTVRVLRSRDEYYAACSAEFVEETFHGSLPAFLAAFTRRQTLSDAEIEEIRKIIGQ